MKFKHLMAAILLAALPLITVAQDDDFEHLLKDKKISFSIFGGPIFEFSSVQGNFGLSSGGGGALILNQSLFIGGYGLGLAPVIGKDVVLNNVDYENLEIGFGHGGLWLGYIHNYRKLLHFGGSTKFGWGNISLEGDQLPNTFEDNVLVIIPQIEAEVNVSRWFKINIGAGYRIVTGVNENVFEQRDFNSPEASIGFIFGWFRKKE